MMTLAQFCRGQAIRFDDTLQIRRQLHGHRTNFFPVGADLMGVASLQDPQRTTCCIVLLS